MVTGGNGRSQNLRSNDGVSFNRKTKAVSNAASSPAPFVLYICGGIGVVVWDFVSDRMNERRAQFHEAFRPTSAETALTWQ